MSAELQRPIFVVGTGRCGSTLLYEALARHPDLAWFSHYDDRFPRSRLATRAPRVYDLLPWIKRRSKGKGGRLRRLLPMPDECYRKWSLLTRPSFRTDYLIDAHATADEVARTHTDCIATVQLQRRRRFLAKLTGPTRITFLRSIFPDALFVHVVRDPRAVTLSLLDSWFWTDDAGANKPRWDNGLSDDWRKEWQWHGRTQLALTAMQVRRILEVCRDEQTTLREGQFMSLDYDAFVIKRKSTLKRLLEFCGLDEHRRVRRYFEERPIVTNTTARRLARLTEVELAMLNEILAAWLPA